MPTKLQFRLANPYACFKGSAFFHISSSSFRRRGGRLQARPPRIAARTGDDRKKSITAKIDSPLPGFPIRKLGFLFEFLFKERNLVMKPGFCSDDEGKAEHVRKNVNGREIFTAICIL